MIEFIKEYKRLFSSLILLFFFGKFGGTIVGIGASVLFLFYFWSRGGFIEVFAGFFLLALFASGLTFPFAKPARNVYMLLLSVLMIWDNFQKVVELSYFYRSLGLFFLYSLPLLALSETFAISLQKNVSFILIYLCLPPFVYSMASQQKKDFLSLLIYLLFMFLATGIICYLLGFDFAIRLGRYRGLTGNPNEVGMFSVAFLITLFIIREFSNDEFISDRLALLSKILIICSIFLSGSRSSTIALSIFFLFRQFKVNWLTGTLLVFAIVLFYESVIEGGVSLVSYLGYGELFRLETVDMAGGRIHGWTYAWKHIQENFFFGKGWVFDEYIFAVGAKELMLLNHQGGVHNSFLGVWLNTGIIGLALFLFGIIKLFVKASRYSENVLPAFYSFVFIAGFEPWMQSSLNAMTIMMIIFLTLAIYSPYIYGFEPGRLGTHNDTTKLE